MLGALRAALEQDGQADLPGFGVLHTVVQAGRRGRHPKTEELIEILPAATVRFRPARALRDAARARLSAPGGLAPEPDEDLAPEPDEDA